MEKNFTPAQPNIEVRPQVRVPTQRPPRLDGESFGAVVTWPLAQAGAVGGAAFLMSFALLNYWSYGRVWVAMSVSANFQFAALWGVCAGCVACVVFFMVDEVAFFVRTMAHWYAEHRNRKQDEGLVATIYQLKNLCAVMRTDITMLERDKARLEGQLRSQPKQAPARVEPASMERMPDDEAVARHREHLATAFVGVGEPNDESPDDHTARQMADAMKILICGYDTGSIARDTVKPRMGMTTAQWENGRDFLMLEGVVGERAPRGYELIADAKAAIDALQRRMDARKEAAAAGMVGA